METTRNDTSVEISSRPTNRCRCTMVVATLCLVVATVAFFGSVATIVWLVEHKVPYKYSVVCFMVGSGILYIVAFTSSLLLLTKGHSRRSMPVSREEPNVGSTGCAPSDGGCETASDISYRGSSRLLQLPQMTNVTQTPPPPYKDPPKISTSPNDADQVQTTQDSNNSGSSLDRFYYELNRDEVPERELVVRPCLLDLEHAASGFDIEMQPMSTSHARSSNDSRPITNALKQQMASNSSLPLKTQGGEFREGFQNPIGNSKHQESISSVNSPRSGLKVKTNPSQVAKRKLKATLSMSHPDLRCEGSRNSRSNLNPEGKSPRSDCNGDTRSLQSNHNSQGTPRIPRSNAEERASKSILSSGGRQRDFRLDCNEDSRSFQSNLNPQGTPGLPRSNPETRISLSNLTPQSTPRILRSNAGALTSQSNLTPEKRLQATQLDLNEKLKSSPSNLQSGGARANLIRTSQMNLVPGARLQASQRSLNVDIEKSSLNPEDRKQDSLSKLYLKRKQYDSNLPSDRRFTFQSNMHLNTQQGNSNSYSYGLQHIPQADSNSNASLNISRSNMVDVDLQHTSQPVKQLKKLSQPQQFVANSKSVPQLQKAQSFTSLSVSNQLAQAETIPKTTYKGHLPNESSTRHMSGRSIESVLDATSNNKQMTPEEWIVALNRGFHKLPMKESDKIVGVRI